MHLIENRLRTKWKMASPMHLAVGKSKFVNSATGLEVDDGPISRVHEIKTPKVSCSSRSRKVWSVPHHPAGGSSAAAAVPPDERVRNGHPLPHGQTPHLCGANWSPGNMGRPLVSTLSTQLDYGWVCAHRFSTIISVVWSDSR